MLSTTPSELEANQSGSSGTVTRTNEGASEAASGSNESARFRKYASTPLADAKHPTAIASPLSCIRLLAFPMDIIYEIFGQLYPLDLANLAQTNRAFRAFLLESPQSDGLWKTVKVVAGETPDGPLCVPQVAWVRAMYCEYECAGCGQYSRDEVDFVLLRRICFECRWTRLLHHDWLISKSEHPILSALVLQLIPYTSMRTLSGSDIPGKRYWEPEIAATTAKVLKYWEDIEAGKPGATEALDQYKEERVQYTRAIIEHGATCKEWLRIRKKEEQALRATQYKRCVPMVARVVKFRISDCFW
ncbi:uncharacterized protein B0H18DRAFT_1016420 [Fomitopsis serialis]|uniref:uncharacterized protein n=1 Tax=Fomitopsis serialis TaxID=139415 RepID=UPI002007F05D|nr:uncharacterized protein B0H18DRAFT_1016420 [Neoantrodia serialis]KAH9922975.1 hypothetical protein B0H18DRAFT_1016420 [Neoantrodia serialis]